MKAIYTELFKRPLLATGTNDSGELPSDKLQQQKFCQDSCTELFNFMLLSSTSVADIPLYTTRPHPLEMESFLTVDVFFMGGLLLLAVLCFFYVIVPPLARPLKFTKATHILQTEIPMPVDAEQPVTDV